jgi:uncharacterized protein
MSESLSYRGAGAMTRDRVHTLFGQTMGYVAITTGVFALGAYLGRNLSAGWAIVWFIVAFVCLIAMNFAVRRSGTLAVALLLVFGVTLGLAMAPTLVYYASTNPQALWQAGGATALFIAGFGAAGYATRRDLSGIARLCFWAHRPHRVRHCPDLRPYPGRRSDLLRPRPGDLRRADHVRFPAAAALEGPRLRAAARGIDLP